MDSLRSLYWPIKRHNWSQSPFSLWHKRVREPRNHKKRVVRMILSEYYPNPNIIQNVTKFFAPLTKTLSPWVFDRSNLGTFDITCGCPFNCGDKSSAKRFEVFFFRVDPGNQALACTKESMGRGRWYAVACICKTDHLQTNPTNPTCPKRVKIFKLGPRILALHRKTCAHASGFVTLTSELLLIKNSTISKCPCWAA